jgi:hypothetical protein
VVVDRLFHTWERHLASVSKDRVVRPFEWGLEWLALGPAIPPAATGPLGNAASPLDVIDRWVDGVMADTTAFFDVEETSDYEFTPVEGATPGRGGVEEGVLRFPSAFVTPHVENNTVVARWFPAAREPRVGVRGARGRAVLMLPQWNSDAGGHIGLAQVLSRFGVSALRLSLPYHDTRMPPELTRADYIVSANVARTVQVCRQAVLDARRAIAWLARQGFERIGILGTSLGSCLALLTAAHEPRVKVQALNHVSPWFADVVWRGLSTRHVRQGLDGNVNLDQLRRLWRPINPWSYLDRIATTPALLVYAKYDLTFPVDLSRLLIGEFERRGLRHDVATLPCGHYSTGIAPFKFIDAYLLTRFLRRML